MASIVIGDSVVDYSLADGRVRSFVLDGKKLYDEDDGTSDKGWRQALVDFVRQRGLDEDRDGMGLHAFVYRMIDDGLLTHNARGQGPATQAVD